MSGQWVRDSSGYYRHLAYPDLWVRSTNSVGYCRWEVVRSRHFPRRAVELLGRYKLLADAKRAVNDSGAVWTRATG